MSTKEDKTQLFLDVYTGKIPARVPIAANVTAEFAIQYAGQNLSASQWDLSKLEEASIKVCQDFQTDIFPVNLTRIPAMYECLGSKTFVQGSSGFMQHPEIHALEANEYHQLIDAPMDTIINVILPRLYEKLNDHPMECAQALTKAYMAKNSEFARFATFSAKMKDQYHYADIPSFYYPIIEAPFDFLADFIRGFKGIFGDIRRHSVEVIQACDAMMPIMIQLGIPKQPHFMQCTGIPLHMPPYMRKKDFEKFYWPSFQKIIEAVCATGQGVYLFAEHDFTNYLEYFQDLPENIRFRFEYGDPATIKEKLGKKFILSGLYPSVLLCSESKQACIDKAKSLLDIMAPGGRYMFDFDKDILTTKGINTDNLIALFEYLQTVNY